MFKLYFLILFVGHIIGDFYLQTDKIAEQKNNGKLMYLFIHGGLYAFSMIAPAIIVFAKIRIIIIAVIMSVVHFVVDWGKRVYVRHRNNGMSNKPSIFYIDQIVHIITLIIAAECMALNKYPIEPNSFFSSITAETGVEYTIIIKIALIILLNAKPINIFIKKLTESFKPAASNSNTVGGAGALIGCVERWIISLLFGISQYALIGFILTAKSLARYKQLEEASFAEYYLLGTLLSSLCAILSYILIF